MKNYVLGFYFDGDDVLLIHKLIPEWQRGKVNGLGGSIEPDETPEAAMVREFVEESGIETTPEQWNCVAQLWSSSIFPKTGNDWYMYVYRGVGKIPCGWKWETNEGTATAYNINGLPPNLEQTARWLCPLCYDKSTLQAEVLL